MTTMDWIVFGACWSLPAACWVAKMVLERRR